MAQITMIGAGSTIFTKRLLGDIFLFPELADSKIVLHDIDAERLATSEIVAHKVAEACNVPAEIESTLDRRQALDGADFVICMIQVGGYEPATVIDFEIPQRYGLRQTIADTLGIGGIMRALRTIPVLIDICRDMEELCPDALLLNYVNPMAMICWAIEQATSIRTVGLCHSVPHTANALAADIGVPVEEINYLVAGVNHMAFFLKFEQDGVDLYPRLFERGRQRPYPVRKRGMVDGVRYEIMKHFGYFVTESSEHLAEYVPWFIKRDRPDLLEDLDIPLNEYIRRCERQIAEWNDLREQLVAADQPLTIERSVEYGSYIIHSMVTGQPALIYGNVPNQGVIENLPADCIVEVPCVVDKNGIQPTRIGRLPVQLAALMQTNINVQALTVEAALTGRRDHVYQAAMVDPHTAAELDLEQIHDMVDDLLDAHQEWLPAFNVAVPTF